MEEEREAPLDAIEATDDDDAEEDDLDRPLGDGGTQGMTSNFSGGRL